MSPRQVFVSQWGNGVMKNQLVSLWQARIKREKTTEGNDSGSNFNTVCDFKDYFLLHNVYRKSVIKMLWKITTGEHTANIKGLRGHESSLLKEGTEKRGTAEAQHIGTRGNWLFTTFGTMRQALRTQILKIKTCSNKEWSQKMLLCCWLEGEKQTFPIIKQTQVLGWRPKCTMVTCTCTRLTIHYILAVPVNNVQNGKDQSGIGYASTESNFIILEQTSSKIPRTH